MGWLVSKRFVVVESNLYRTDQRNTSLHRGAGFEYNLITIHGSRTHFAAVKPHAARLDLGTYPYTVDIQTRFADVDPLWHLNNVRILEIYQEARVSFNFSLWGQHDLTSNRGYRILVARQSVDYVGEVRWPDALTVGVGVSRVGGTSFSLGMAMFQARQCVGVSDTVLVYATQQGPVPLPDTWRAILKQKLLPEVVLGE
jgi:acyl-CoA thioester hydrolase